MLSIVWIFLAGGFAYFAARGLGVWYRETQRFRDKADLYQHDQEEEARILIEHHAWELERSEDDPEVVKAAVDEWRLRRERKTGSLEIVVAVVGWLVLVMFPVLVYEGW